MPSVTRKKAGGTPTLIRPIHKGDSGPDVYALKRALKAAGYPGAGAYRIILNQTFGAACDRALRRFQHDHGLHVDGVLGADTFKKLLPSIDAYGRSLFAKAPTKTKEEETYARLLSFMEKMTRDTPGYLLGGGHGIPLKDVSTRQKLDCSSSVSLALWEVGLFPDDTAWNSTGFERYGSAGRGQFFSVFANGDHVWIRTWRGPYNRFDTSPWRDGGYGPRLRKLPRSTRGFVERHHDGY